MLAHDAMRTGSTPEEIRPPFERKWYRLFPDEGLMAGLQPILAEGRVFLGTLRGTFYALDAETGKDVWKFRAGGPILHAGAVADGRVFFGCADGKVYALDASNGGLLWSLPTGAAVWNAPAVWEGVVFIGSRDGSLYAIEAKAGKVLWRAKTGGPLLNSPALDPKRRRVYIGSEDMHVYAFHSDTGALLWRSPQLPGVSLRGYHPVIAPDGSVMVTTMPSLPLDDILHPILCCGERSLVREVFGLEHFHLWRYSKEEQERVREKVFALLARPETYKAQLAFIRRRLEEQPAYQTFFVLHPETGRPKFVAPIVYAESMNGPGAPPIVTPDGQIIVKFQALLRSRYGHYSPFLNVGFLDTTTGHITPLMDQSRTYGWHESLLLVHDEQSQLVVAGRMLINAHQDNVNALNLETREGYEQPFCRNIHEPHPGEALGIWTHLWRGETLPVGKEWLARGTAVYGGGSAVDTCVVVSGDSFYYLPTHELNAGCALIAYRMAPQGTAHQEHPLPSIPLREEEIERLREAPWDWDILETPRLRRFVLDTLPAKVPGTRQQPLTEQARARVAAVGDADLERFIWAVKKPQGPKGDKADLLRARLDKAVGEVVSALWRPLAFPPGKHPPEAYWLFLDPTETLYALSRAYPFLTPNRQKQVREYVAALRASGGPLEGPLGRPTMDIGRGKPRELYDIPVDLVRFAHDIVRSDVARLYPLWLWAEVAKDWGDIRKHWPALRPLVHRKPNPFEEDCHNGHLAGLIAYCRLAKRMGDEEALGWGVRAAREAMRERLLYEFAHPKGGLITPVPVSRTIFGRWRHLTPEVGEMLATYAGDIHRELMRLYVDYHRPTWWLAWGVELLWRNESPFSFPTMSLEVFSARAFILKEPFEALEGFLDLPWCRADLGYIQKLVLLLEALGSPPKPGLGTFTLNRR